MKKIVLVGLVVVLLVGCGKIEKGAMTIENKSTHIVDIEFAQNYSSEFIKLQPNDTITRSWERYFHCIIENPSTNILKKQQTKEKITILNNDAFFTYKITNGAYALTMLDNGRCILALSAGVHAASIPINIGRTEIKTFKPISVTDIIFDKGTPFSIGSETYYPVEKKGDVYYYNKDNGGVLDSRIINIRLIDSNIEISF